MEKTIKGKFYIRLGDSSGFFANFVFVLGDMWYADSMGMYPVVVWGAACPYYEKNGVNGIFNVWEYYFEQYKDYHLEDLNSAFRVSDIPKNVRELAFGIRNGYELTEEYMLELARTMKKYVRLKPDVEDYISKKIKCILLGKRTLGVQIRMGGMLGNYNNHPIVPTLDEYVAEISRIFNKGYDQIFLATDDNRALQRMKEDFGSNVVYYSDATRVDGEYSTYCTNIERKLHNYKCGLEVLLDMYTLAACEGLVAGLSQVAIVAQIVIRADGREYDDLRIINKGLNSNKRRAPHGTEEMRQLK